MNCGKVDRKKLESAAKTAGISKAELDKALAERRLSGVSFISGQV